MPDAAAKRPRHSNSDAAGSAPAREDDDDDDKQDSPVLPNERGKPWTEEQRTQFFTWVLEDDMRWSVFQVNNSVIFKQFSDMPFAGQQKYKTIKSHYSRSLALFKRLDIFETFANTHLSHLKTTNADWDVLSLQAALDAAAAGGVDMTGLNVKVVQTWHKKGWFALFKKRYPECAHTPPVIDPELMLSQHPSSGFDNASSFVPQTYQFVNSTSTFPCRPSSATMGDSDVCTQLTTVTTSLLEVCSSLKTFIQQQTEESKVRTELMRYELAGHEMEQESRPSKAYYKY
ncbi:hypothetical protein C8T65DRAFT_736427 [Cerioporus squamosus]|nr:hypothetical protein C8T65DRAFT_748619 [Cerioporus squamosus]KAI0690140.1 hypothetical protein C8T65DRAFT_745931 [Cerioporus squamosus]KAI0719875.1 hypothetical protein C8T65DRAFT_736427 [Cerioporus squamosus]